MATLKDLLNSPWEEWEKLSDAELTKLCEPYFKVTRPDQRPKVEKKSTIVSGPIKASPKQAAKVALSKSKHNAELMKLINEKAAQLGLPSI